MGSVVRATLRPVTSGGPTVAIVRKFYYEHASRQCVSRGSDKPPACICAGGSLSLAWVAKYEYSLKTGGNSFVGKALAEGRAFVRVVHDRRNWRIPAEGTHEELDGFRAVEYFRILPGGSSEEDCIHGTRPFQRKVQCGYRSEQETEITLLVSDTSKIPDASIESFEVVGPGGIAGGGTRTTKPVRGSPRTPRGVNWQSPNTGGPVSDKRRIRPAPEHCDDWSRYVHDDGGLNKNNQTRVGEYDTPTGKPPGSSAVGDWDRPASESVESREQRYHGLRVGEIGITLGEPGDHVAQRELP